MCFSQMTHTVIVQMCAFEMQLLAPSMIHMYSENQVKIHPTLFTCGKRHSIWVFGALKDLSSSLLTQFD